MWDLVSRMERGREFQTVGAAKENDLRPVALSMRGTVRRLVLEDLSDLVGA